MNIKLLLSFNGSSFVGWQIQNNKNFYSLSVQSCLQKVLFEIYKEEVKVIGCSRLDSSVNAKYYCATYSPPFFIQNINLQKAINAKIHKNIFVFNVTCVNDFFHPRYDAKSKLYIYKAYTSNYINSFDGFSYFLSYKLHAIDFENMKKCCKLFLGEHDFRGFSLFDTENFQDKNTICKISYIDLKIFRHGNSKKLYFIIKGNRFLHKMIRFIVGSIIDVGKNTLSIDQVLENLKYATRKHKINVVPGNALFLKKVYY